jgi:hypothetical protein
MREKIMDKGRFNKFAIASLTMGIISFIQIAGMEKAIAAIVFGVLALKGIAAPENRERGEGLAAAAIVLGVIYIIVAGIALFALMKNPELLEQILRRPIAK